MKVKVKRLHPDAILPTYGTEGAGAFDLYTTGYDWGMDAWETGLSFEIPKDHVMLVFSRSGHGFSRGLSLVNSVGVIDSDYRGEVMVKFKSEDPEWQQHYASAPGERIAQAIILPYPKIEWEEVEELDNTQRGQGGFGSTGS